MTEQETECAMLRRAVNSLLVTVDELMQQVNEPPEANCSCFISPPCNDCVEHAWLREVIVNARAAIKLGNEALQAGAHHE